MNAYALIPLVSFIITLFTWAVIFARNRTLKANRAYLLFSGSIIFWLFTDYLSWMDFTDRTLSAIHGVTALGWMPCGFFFLNFVYSVLERPKDKLLWAFAPLLAISLVLHLTTDLVWTGVARNEWGSELIHGPLFTPISVILVALPITIALVLIVLELRQEKTSRRKSLVLLSWGAGTILVIGVITDIILPLFPATRDLPSLASESSFILSVFVYLALTRYGFLLVDIETAAIDLFNQIGDGVIITDVRGHISLYNSAAETMFSSLSLRGRLVDELFEDYVEAETFEDHELKTREGNMVVAVSQAPVRQRGNEIGKLLIIRDLTRKTELNAEIIRRQRIESIGLLAGGIAHDFNNILTSIVSNITLVKMDLEAGDPSLDFLFEAERAAYDARHLTQQLLTFSKGGEPIRKATSIKEIVQSSLHFSLSGSNVVYIFEPPDDLWNVNADEGQLNQVVNNLIINAIQAMPAGGRIEIQALNVQVTESSDPLVKRGDYVELRVIDEGPGIPAEHLEKIFDPYFTTKPKGTGLGLASAFSIIQKHGGMLSVDTKLGVGSLFRILLPATHEKQATSSIVTTPVTQEKKRVLLMDDDESILRAGSRILKRYGYEPMTARDGSEALDLYEHEMSKETPIDVVIMDLTIPGGMGGKEAIQRLLELDPNARAIVSSGYSNDPVMSACEEHGFRAVVSKPYEIRDFIATLERVSQEERPALPTEATP